MLRQHDLLPCLSAPAPCTIPAPTGTYPRPMQPSRRLTSRCSSPSSRERSSGEKESGSSTACRRRHGRSHREHTSTKAHMCMGTGMCTDMRTCAQTHTDPHMYRIHAGRCAHTYTCTRAHTRAMCTPSPVQAHTHGYVCAHTRHTSTQQLTRVNTTQMCAWTARRHCKHPPDTCV